MDKVIAAFGLSFLIAIGINSSYADCSKFDNKRPFEITLDANVDVKKAILDCLATAKINKAAVTGELNLKDPVFSYFDMKSNKNLIKKFPGVYEVAGFTGNIEPKSTDPLVQTNIHAVLIDEHHRPVGGGHLWTGVVGIHANITIYPLQD